MARRAIFAAAVALLLAGCGGAALETAHTTPRGTIAVDMATSYVINEHNDDRTAMAHFWPDLGLRYGATDNLDVGVRMLLLGGVPLVVGVGDNVGVMVLTGVALGVNVWVGVGLCVGVLVGNASPPTSFRRAMVV